MRSEPFGFWTSNQTITYTDLDKFCREQYELKAPGLINSVRQCLEVYQTTPDKRKRFEALRALDDLSLQLSCFNLLWNDFSTAIFEVLVLPKQSVTWEATYIKQVFLTTLRRLDNGNSNSDSNYTN